MEDRTRMVMLPKEIKRNMFNAGIGIGSAVAFAMAQYQSSLTSSFLLHASFDDNTGIITIQMKGGRSYGYRVNKSMYDGLLSANSKGRYFIDNIKPLGNI